jgi:hypothetical protein
VNRSINLTRVTRFVANSKKPFHACVKAVVPLERRPTEEIWRGAFILALLLSLRGGNVGAVDINLDSLG